MNRIKALIFGQAIGDALGLASEFMTKDEVKRFYPNGIRSYNDIIQDRHRSLWQKGAWTDDTDQMLCILYSIIENKAINLTDIAKRFVLWKQTNGIGIGRHTLNVLSIGDYVENPFKASELIWNMSRKKSAANGAIMRTAILGCWNYTDWDQVKSNTENVCKLTHYDPRCVGSCVIITYIVHRYLTNQDILKSDILCIANEYDSRIIEYVELAFQNNINALALDEQGKIGYTLKTMSAVLWAYNYSVDFYSGLKIVIEEGGDADTNGAIIGALLGLKFGLNTIPKHLIDNLVGKDVLANRINDVGTIMQSE
ncbi:ADP-ribosylglycohydrolase family protein [Dysgonomonas capnocytophagoides]|uniref:ADP-ribosylglycohydrolase family protein n=1 Tax=Dysgonomonas capnocytophagoides TaxID=45254 RepID=UPI00333EAFEB